MKKIMIVDDELLVRIGVKSIVSWEKHGYLLIGEAGSGNEALDKIRAERPDIVLTDLVMEDGDGFQLMKACAEEFPWIRFVILSGYDDLEHVKKAMKLGAVDYIFKLTLNPQQIIEVLDGIDLGSSNSSKKEGQALFYKNREAVKNSLFKKAASSQFRLTEELMEQLKRLPLTVDMDKEYNILYLSIDNYCLYEKNGDKRLESDLLKYAAENIAQEVIAEKYPCEIFDFVKGDMAAVIQSEWRSLGAREAEELFGKINSQLKRYLNISVSGSAELNTSGIQYLPEQIANLQNRILERFLSGQAGFGKQSFLGIQDQPESVSDQMKELREALLNNDSMQAMNSLEAIGGICRKDKLNPELCRIIYFDVLGELKRDMHLRQFVHTFWDKNGYGLYDGIMKYDFLSNIQEAFTDFLKSQGSLAENRTKYRREILEVKAYVRQNISGPLTVPNAARRVCMSDNYFSHVFKKETGISFIDYVNQERIEKAKELLLSTDDKIYEIAERVGISSANYFGILFRRMTGKSPNEFREEKNRNRKS